MFDILSNKALFNPNNFPIRKNSYHDKGYGACDDFIMGVELIIEYFNSNYKQWEDILYDDICVALNNAIEKESEGMKEQTAWFKFLMGAYTVVEFVFFNDKIED